jgi:hypothetical protein
MKHVEKERMHNFLSDLLSVEKHTLEAVKKQKEMGEVKADEEVYEILQHIEKTLAFQVDTLHGAAERFGSKAVKDVKSAISGLYGKAVGAIAKRRIDPASKAMRDNYTAISMITAGYTMLMTTAVAEKDENLQQIAGNSLQELAQLTVEINRILPLSVARGLIDNREEADRIGKLAVEKTGKAWKWENLQNAEDVT